MGEQQLRTFWEFGYLPVGQVSEPGELAALRRTADAVLTAGDRPLLAEDHLVRSEAAGPGAGHVRVALHLCHRLDVCREHAVRGRGAGIVTRLFGEPAAVLTSLLFNKPPGVGMETAWHQDVPYYPYLGDDDLITVWTALDDVGKRNGAVEYLPGSHRARITHHSTGGQQALDIPVSTLPAGEIQTFYLRRGDAVLHHGLTVHRSGANVSDQPRRGLATLYVPASCRITPDDFAYQPIPASRGNL